MPLFLNSGRATTKWYTRKESVTYTVGDLTYIIDSDPGYLIPADATSGNHIGVSQFAIDDTKSNFATTNEKFPVLVPGDAAAEWIADVDGTLATTHIGEYWDLSAAGTVNVAASAKRVVLCTGFISATKGLFKINATAYTANVTVS